MRFDALLEEIEGERSTTVEVPDEAADEAVDAEEGDDFVEAKEINV
jgi:hypothetical protein